MSPCVCPGSPACLSGAYESPQQQKPEGTAPAPLPGTHLTAVSVGSLLSQGQGSPGLTHAAHLWEHPQLCSAEGAGVTSQPHPPDRPPPP